MDDNVRFCKKCGAELPTDYKHKKCEYCRLEKAGNWRKIGEGALAVGAFVVAAFVAIGQHEANKEDTDNDDNEI